MEFVELGLWMFHLIAKPFRAAAERRRHRRLRKAWGTWARSRNWMFLERWPGMVEAFTSMPFGRGGDRQARFGYEGEFEGVPVLGFSHQYSMGSGAQKKMYHHHVSLMRVPGAQFSTLTVTPENWVTRVLGRDVQFEAAEFNRRWLVLSESARFAHAVVHPRMMEWLTAAALPRSSTLVLERDAIVLATPGVLEPDQVDEHLRLLVRTAALVPRFVLKDSERSDPADES